MKRLLIFIVFLSNITYGQVRNNPDHDPPEIINAYAEVLAFNICTNEITVSDASNFNPGDTVLMIQMKGAIIDTSNTAAFGTILDYGNAGNYEFNYISQKSGNIFKFLNRLTRTYDIPDGVVQLIRVPKYKDGYFSGGLTCADWDGKIGGVLAVFSTTSLTSVEDIFVNGKGFRGAEAFNASLDPLNCGQNNYYYPASSQFAAFKGESIGSFSQSKIKGKGSFGGGGGGGNSQNSGGGGGANAGAGGNGGFQTDSCSNAPVDNGGIGGRSLQYNSTAEKIFMGSGGGAGHIDNADIYAPAAGSGGGIIIIVTGQLEMFDELISANGAGAYNCVSTDCSDGNSGGGAGGTILLSYTGITGVLNIETKGGNGADMLGPILPGGRTGPGGGGGGGILYTNGISFPPNVAYFPDGGSNGVIVQDANNNWGATAGNPGTNFFDLVIPVDTVLFTPNIDSVRIKDSANYCNNIQFTAIAPTNTFALASWQWYFGDGTSSSAQNPIHNYSTAGNYDVKLIVTDINGCKDSVIKTINSGGTILLDAGTDTAFCVSVIAAISVVLNGSSPVGYSWSPAAVLNNPTLQNPTATINNTTKFYLAASNGTGCSAVDSVTVTINQNPVVKTLSDTSICRNAVLVLTTNGALNYNWSPAIYVSNSTIANPMYADTLSHTLIVTGTSANGCKAKDTINIDVRNPTTFIAPQSEVICKGESVQLSGNNGNAFEYLWSPAAYLNDPTIENPVANPPLSTTYTLKVSDNICKNDSSFTVGIIVIPSYKIYASKSNDLSCIKPFAQLNVYGASNFAWSPSYGLSNDSIANPIANPAYTTTYYVTGTDSALCNGKDSVTVVADFKNHGIFLPNSFTPNNDGLNDCFGIKYYRDVTNLDFIIFNRYGIEVFKTHDASRCWDGNYKGKPASTGNYVYFIKARTLCGEVAIRDNFLLIR